MNGKIMLRKVVAIATTSLVLGLSVPAAAGDEVDIYTLCSKFPLNSRCQGYQIPVPLEERSGDLGECSLKTGETTKEGDCKVLLTEQKITIYMEEGEELEILQGQKTTREYNISIKDITALSYKKESRTPTSRRVRNFLLFGVLGAALTRPDKLAQIDIGFTDSSPNQPVANTLTLLLKRDTGTTLKDQLVQLTGITAVEPEANS
ncbi:hypothetical protein [Microseira sp. BLCC-F43]|uniref:hypothetical protein n=1 Tax=Microseira sp. BLCC-F43 TaxID=3153602 RepID=UPI0035BA452D